MITQTAITHQLHRKRKVERFQFSMTIIMHTTILPLIIHRERFHKQVIITINKVKSLSRIFIVNFQHSNYSEGEEKSIPPLRKKSILHNPLTPRQQAQQLSSLNNHNASHVTEPITHQPTNAPPYVPHLQMNGL